MEQARFALPERFNLVLQRVIRYRSQLHQPPPLAANAVMPSAKGEVARMVAEEQLA